MKFDVKTVNKLLDIDESYKAPEKMLQLMLDDKKRPELFKKFLQISTDLKTDWFHEYFEDEQAERKSKKQDFTPDSIAQLLVSLGHSTRNGEYFEPAAGTGGILIKAWWKNQLEDPVRLSKFNSDKHQGISLWSYDPRNYWYHVEEMSDRAVPFLIFNMAIRGMTGVIVQCDSLERIAKDVFFIKNDTANSLAFSEVYKMKHTKDLQQCMHIKKWVDKF